MPAPLVGGLIRLFSTRSSKTLFSAYTLLGKLEKYSGAIRTLDQVASFIERKQQAKRLARILVSMTERAVYGNVHGLRPKSPASRKIQQSGESRPLINRGQLLSHLKIEERGTGYSVGWDRRVLKSSSGIATTRGRRRRMGAYTLVRLLEKGARIPVDPFTPKGRAVRLFLAVHGIFVRKTKKYLYIPPRPFWSRTVNKFIQAYSGRDGIKIVNLGYRVFISVDPGSGKAFAKHGLIRGVTRRLR